MILRFQKYLVFAVSLCFTASSVCAQLGQVPDAQVEAKARDYLSQQGVDESELRQRLIEKGIDVDNLSPQELLNVRPQIEAAVAEIKSEQAERLNSEITSNKEIDVDQGSNVNPEVNDETVLRDNAITSTPKEKRSSTTKVKTSDIYGHEVFRNKTLDVYRASTKVTTPNSYVLGVGDVIAISIFGASQTDLLLEVGDDGFIKPNGVPRIYLRGRTLSDARRLVKSRMSNYYVFGEGQFSLTVDAARTITVSVYGEVEQSGTYTLSALNGPFNALVAAGGPTEEASIRNIELVRDGKRLVLDLYEFLQNPEVITNLSLADGDIISVPLSQKVVQIVGGVKRPMKYELKPLEKLDALVNLAGGTIPKAATNVTRVERYADGVLAVLDTDETAYSRFSLQNGDVVEIPIVNKPIKDFVSVSGEVLIDGKFGFRQNMALSNLIRRAQLKPTARKDLAFLKRINDDGTNRLERLDITSNSKDLEIKLQRGDELKVLASSRFIDNTTFSVSGSIRDSSITLPYPQDGKLSITEAILLGGGLTANAVAEALVIRTPEKNNGERNYIRVDLEKESDFSVEPNDDIIIYGQERFSDKQTVSISGAVRTAIETPYDVSLGINDLIFMAGGLSYDAARDRIEIYRLDVSLSSAETLVKTLSVDANGSISESFELKPYDQVRVRSIAEFSPIESVTLSGEVRFPGIYARLKGKNRISDFISRAGGLTSDAFANGATLKREGKQVVIQLSYVIANPALPSNIVLRPGDELIIPKPKETVVIETKNTYATSFGSDELTTNGLVEVAYIGQKQANWYINNFAGGYTKDAKRNSVTVTHADGGIEETKSFLGIKKYPKVGPGSKIYIPTKPPKKEKPARERTSWSEIAQVVVAAMTTVATLIIISR